MVRQFLLAITWLLILENRQGVSQDVAKPDQVIELFENSIRAIRSFDLEIEVNMRFLLRSERIQESEKTAQRTRDPSRLKLSKLPPGEAASEKREFYRQVYADGKGRVELLEARGGKPSKVITYDDEIGRARDVGARTAAISRVIKTAAIDGGDYRETYRSVLSGIMLGDLARCLSQREGYVVVHGPETGSGLLTLEAKPIPAGRKVNTNFARWGFKVILDPRRGTLPAAIEVWQPIKGNPHLYRRTAVNRWKDLGNGVWAPTKATTHIYYLDNGTHPHLNGEIANESILTVDESRSSWNKPVGEELLRNPLPAGTMVTDTERGVRFVTGKADPGKNLADLAKHARNVGPINTSRRPDATPWWAWAFGGVAVALVVGAGGVVVWLLRKRRLGKFL